MLPTFRLRIVTNSLSVFNLLEAREDCELCLVGGMYRRRTAAFVGPTAEDTLRALGIDAAFIGANGILTVTCLRPTWTRPYPAARL